MKLCEKIDADIAAAMKAHAEQRLTMLRMVKSVLKNKEIEKREALTDADETQILTTLIEQRKESVESFTKGGRPELAKKEVYFFNGALLPGLGDMRDWPGRPPRSS